MKAIINWAVGGPDINVMRFGYIHRVAITWGVLYLRVIKAHLKLWGWSEIDMIQT